MSLILPLNLNDRSIPLTLKAVSFLLDIYERWSESEGWQGLDPTIRIPWALPGLLPITTALTSIPSSRKIADIFYSI
jgi:hypothetical protein